MPAVLRLRHLLRTHSTTSVCPLPCSMAATYSHHHSLPWHRSPLSRGSPNPLAFAHCHHLWVFYNFKLVNGFFFWKSVSFDIQREPPHASTVFSGSFFYFAHLRGPRKIMIKTTETDRKVMVKTSECKTEYQLLLLKITLCNMEGSISQWNKPVLWWWHHDYCYVLYNLTVKK